MLEAGRHRSLHHCELEAVGMTNMLERIQADTLASDHFIHTAIAAVLRQFNAPLDTIRWATTSLSPAKPADVKAYTHFQDQLLLGCCQGAPYSH